MTDRNSATYDDGTLRRVRERPAGLTALAVLNFALAPLAGLSSASLLRLTGNEGTSMLAILVAGGLSSSILLCISGVGYLRRHRLWGRAVGNAWAILGLGISGATLASPQGFGLATCIGLLYAPVTLACLNLRLRTSFV